jgi:hypothetical protein
MRSAILNYLATEVEPGIYNYEVYYYIDDGANYTDIELDKGGETSKIPVFYNTGDALQASAVILCNNSDTITVRVADISDNTKYYKSVYTASSGSITASEHNISTTITAL